MRPFKRTYYLHKREAIGFQDDSLVHYYDEKLINRLRVTRTLTGHAGSVNSLKWNQAGTIIASGSDDRTVKLWTVAGDFLTTIKTGHDDSIFGVEFMLDGSDRFIASAAGHTVKLHDLNSKEDTSVQTFNTDGRVTRLATAWDDPFLLWSASEDSYIRQHDTRSNEENLLIKAPGNLKVKTMAICQGITDLVAVGTNHPKTNIYDRRNPSRPLLTVASNDFVICPAKSSVCTTHVAFDKNGTQLLVYQGGGNIFIFNLFDNEATVMQKFEQVVKNKSVPESGTLTTKYDEKMKNAKELFTNKKYQEAIEIYNTLIAREKKATIYDRCTFFTNRASAYMRRCWNGDRYAAVKDNLEALKIFPGNPTALWRLVISLYKITQFKMASRCIDLFKAKFPSDKNVHHLENWLKPCLKTNPTEEHELLAASPFRDYTERYCGAQNSGKDMKEANFFGSKEDFIVASSECGSFFIWSRATGNILAGFKADDDILNIVQPHPDHFMLATSGSEKVVRFWGPLAEDVQERRRIIDVPEFIRTRPTGFAPALRLARHPMRAIQI